MATPSGTGFSVATAATREAVQGTAPVVALPTRGAAPGTAAPETAQGSGAAPGSAATVAFVALTGPPADRPLPTEERTTTKPTPPPTPRAIASGRSLDKILTKSYETCSINQSRTMLYLLFILLFKLLLTSHFGRNIQSIGSSCKSLFIGT